MIDVLVFTPVYRLEPETVLSLLRLEHEGPLTLMLQRDNPNGDGYQDHYHQYKRGRELFLSGPYDAMLVIESDVIPPADTLQRLISLESDIAYGCYVFRNQDDPVVNVFERYTQPARNIGESLSVRGLWPAAKEQGVVECSGGGLGCVLIQRHVLQAIPFKPVDGLGGHCDWVWTEDVYRAGYTMKADTAVICGHKDVDGTVLWPS